MTQTNSAEAEVTRSRVYALYTEGGSFEAAVPVLARVVAVGPAGLTEDEYELWRQDARRMSFDPDYDPVIAEVGVQT